VNLFSFEFERVWEYSKSRFSWRSIPDKFMSQRVVTLSTFHLICPGRLQIFCDRIRMNCFAEGWPRTVMFELLSRTEQFITTFWAAVDTRHKMVFVNFLAWPGTKTHCEVVQKFLRAPLISAAILWLNSERFQIFIRLFRRSLDLWPIYTLSLSFC